jgi:hypothetical protein
VIVHDLEHVHGFPRDVVASLKPCILEYYQTHLEEIAQTQSLADEKQTQMKLNARGLAVMAVEKMLQGMYDMPKRIQTVWESQPDPKMLSDDMFDSFILFLQNQGNVRVMSSIVGALMRGRVTLGPMAISILAKSAFSQFKKCNGGKLNPVTHQAQKSSGLESSSRSGYMERDAKQQSAAIGVLMSQMFEQADVFDLVVCECGGRPLVDFDIKVEDMDGEIEMIGICLRCRRSDRLQQVRIPFNMIRGQALNAYMNLHFEFYPTPRTDPVLLWDARLATKASASQAGIHAAARAATGFAGGLQTDMDLNADFSR